MRPFAFAVALAMVLSAGGAAGQPHATCPASADILRLSRTVIDRRPELRGFSPRRFGTEAAYIVIRYGDLSPAAERALLDGLLGEPTRTSPGASGNWRAPSPSSGSALQRG